MDNADRYRCRRIHLKQSDNPAYQANAACDALVNIEGILLATPFNDYGIHIIYSLDKLSFEIVIELLNELEFDIFGFLEDNARDNLHVDVTEFQQDESDDPESPQQKDSDKYWDDYR